METVRSQDGTIIAFDRSGSGPALILVGGALGVRAHPMFADLAVRLSQDFTVYNYDRRGRGDSGDTLPYAVQREIEDIDALIDHAGGSAALYGISSGAVLALEAAAALPAKVSSLALYEPPLVLDDSRPPMPVDYVQRVAELSGSGRRGDAVELFMTVVGVPAEFIPMMKADPGWAEMEKTAHTLAYDGMIMDQAMTGRELPATTVRRWQRAKMPALVMVGGESEPFFHLAGRTLTELLPDADQLVLEGQTHEVSNDALAPALQAFFTRVRVK